MQLAIKPSIHSSNSSKQESQQQEEEKEAQGMTIFGIPIPKIPFSLSFGLAPTISQGLIPLPIGRKGDDPSATDLMADSSEKRRQTVSKDHPKEKNHTWLTFFPHLGSGLNVQ